MVGFTLVGKGLHAFNRHANLETKTLRVLVHPTDDFYTNDDLNPNYEESRDELVASSTEPILLAIPSGDEDLYLAWLEKRSPEGPRLMYLTEFGTPFPIQLPGEKNLHDSVNRLTIDITDTFKAQQLLIGGAEYYPPQSGCVGVMHQMLRTIFKSKIDEEHVWRGALSDALEFSSFLFR